MKLIVKEQAGCCVAVHIEYTPVEALVINQAMRRFVCDDDVHEKDREIMETMLEVKPIFETFDKTEKMRAEIDSLHNGCGLFNDGIDKALKVIDKYME